MKTNYTQVFYFKLIIIIWIFGLNSCTNDKIITKKKTEEPIKQSNEEINIINATLPLIVPNTVKLKQKPQGNLTSEHYRIQLKIDSIKRKKNSDSLGLSLMIEDYLLVADSSIIQLFIDKGGSKMLYALDRKKTSSKHIDTRKISNFNNINVHPLIPLTTSEMDRMIGGINFSKIIFNKEKNRAVFIYSFERYRDKTTSKFCAVEVIKKNNYWRIKKEICIPLDSKGASTENQDYFIKLRERFQQ